MITASEAIRAVTRTPARVARVWADPLFGLAALAILVDALDELVQPQSTPSPLARLLLPSVVVIFLGYIAIRRRPAEAWLLIVIAAAAFAEVNENSLALDNVQLYASFFNNRVWRLPISPFDVLFAAAVLLSLPRLPRDGRSMMRRPLNLLATAVLALFVILAGVAMIKHRSLYDTARDVRPVLVVPALLLLAAPFVAEVETSRLARLVILVGLLKALEGWSRMLLGVGVPHQGVHLAFYDTANNLVAVMGLIVLVTIAASVAVALRWMAVAFISVPLAWSFRRGVYVATASLLAAYAIWAGHRRTARIGLAIAAGLLLVAAIGMNQVLDVASKSSLIFGRIAPASTPLPSSSPGTAAGLASASASIAGARAYESGDVDASNRFRLLDLENAVVNVAHHPVLGLGPGTSYHIYFDGGQPTSAFLNYASHTSHVGYLALALKGGLVGLLLYVSMATAAVIALLRAPSGPERTALLGIVLLFAIMNFVFPLTGTIRPAVLLGMILARAVR